MKSAIFASAVLAATAATALGPAPALAESSTKSTSQAEPVKGMSAEKFATTAAASNEFEIESSKLALEKSKTEAVQSFARMMVDDHTAAGKKMMEAAKADGVTLAVPKLDERHETMLTELKGAGDDAFDKRYVAMQVQAHEEAVALFKAYSGEKGELAKFASETLPTLEKHEAAIKKIANGG